jgi:transposase
MERAELESFLALGLSLEQMGEIVGRHAATVGYWVRKHGLTPVHQAQHAARGGIPEATLRALVDEGLTQREIAERLDRSMGTVRHWLTRYGLRTIRRHWPASGERPKYVRRPCRRHGWTDFADTGERYRCVKCRSEAVVARRRRVKAILVDEAGGRCQRCGYDRYIGALHFHHRDPSTKTFGLSFGGLRTRN